MSGSSPHDRRSELDETAALWAARLRGGAMTDADRAALATWLAADAEHDAALARYRQLCGTLDLNWPGAGATAARRSRIGVWGTAAAVAGLAAIVCVFLALRPQRFVTGPAERRLVTLAEGTRVELNAATELRVSLTGGERRGRIVRGEALFIVAKDPVRPFFVTAPAAVVRVTGTTFNVRADAAGRTEVTVLEGHVRVRGEAETAETPVERYDQAMVASGATTTRPLSPAAAEDVIAWRRGEISFEDVGLREAMERFARYHGRRVRVADAVADLRIGGRYQLDDLEGALDSVQRMLPVRVEREAGGAVYLAPRAGR